jgi:hypothetical protein
MSDLKHYGPAFPQAYEHNQVVNEMLANSRLTPGPQPPAVRSHPLESAQQWHRLAGRDDRDLVAKRPRGQGDAVIVHQALRPQVRHGRVGLRNGRLHAKGCEVIENHGGRFYVRFKGELSRVSATTRAKAQAHADKLEAGLVRFEPYQTRAHDPGCMVNQQTAAGVRARSYMPCTPER